MPTDLLIALQPPPAAAGASVWFDASLFGLNVLIGIGILAGFLRLPRRFDASRVAEISKRQALGMPLLDGVRPADAPRQTVLMVCMVLAGLLLALGLSKINFTQNWNASILTVGTAAFWAFALRRILRLHHAGLVARPTFLLWVERSAMPSLLIWQVLVFNTPLPAPWQTIFLVALASVCAALIHFARRSALSWGAGCAAVFALVFASFNTDPNENLPPLIPTLATGSSAVLAVISPAVLLLIFRRIPRHAIPRGHVWPRPRPAVHA